jgi:glycosyltransferase involved in cell wall biosynthesis
MISPHFPPDSSAGTHRVRLLAPHLSDYGWEPTVLTVAEQDYEGRLDPELASLVPSSLRVVRARALSPHLTRAVGLGDLGLRALPGLRRAAWDLLERDRFDAVFITIYPTYPAVLGPMIKRRFGIPFVLDYQDPWVGAWGRDVGGGANGAVDFKSRSTRAIGERIEPRVLRAADGVTAVSSRTYEDALQRTGATPKEVAEIPIGWDAADGDALSRRGTALRFIPDDGRVNICYAGTLPPMGGDTLRAVFLAARRVIERHPQLRDRVRFYFFGTSSQTASTECRVMAYASECGLSDIVHEQPARLDYLDALAVLRQASALLLMGSSEAHYTASRIFQAILADRPTLAVYHEASTVVDIFNAAAPLPAGHLVTYGDEHPVGHAIDRIAGAFLDVVGVAGQPVRMHREALAPWSASTLARRLAAVFDGVAA